MRIKLYYAFIVFLGLTLPLIAAKKRGLWEETEFVSSCGILSLCNKGVEKDPFLFFQNEYSTEFKKEKYENLQKGDIVWIPPRFISQFYNQILPSLTEPIVLVTSIGDESFPLETGLSVEQINSLLASEKIRRIFAQNCDWIPLHPKVSPLPIGLDYHTVGYKGGSQGGWGEMGLPLAQEAQLKEVIKELPPTFLRQKRAFVDFQLSDTIRGGDKKRYLQLGEDRTSIFAKLQSTGLIDSGPWMRRSALWRTKGNYAFSISPHGNGLDCHRTWEDLVLGCIVIVKTSPLDSLYEGLAVVIVKNWDEITEENLNLWFEKYKDASTNPMYRKKLTRKYWADQIKTAAIF